MLKMCSFGKQPFLPQDSVTVVGVAKFSLKPVTSGLEEFFRTDGKAEGLTYPVRSFTLPEEVDRGK